jgi:hypothetical protein
MTTCEESNEGRNSDNSAFLRSTQNDLVNMTITINASNTVHELSGR